MDDLYSILGVSPNASANEIRSRYRFLAQAFHPDKFLSIDQKQQAEEEFKKINNAYQTLSVPRKRTIYDSKRNPSRGYSRKTTEDKTRQTEQTAQQKADSRKRQEEQTAQRKKEEAIAAVARQRAREEIAKREEQRKRSKKWIVENQTAQKGARLRGVDLRNCSLADANFEDADLRDANLNGSSLYFAKLARADLTNSKLIYAWLCTPNYKDTRAADATLVLMKGANLKCARIGNANFSGANLENADLTKAVMDGVNLTGANLVNANLTKASLQDANFTNAIFVGSNLKDANLWDANFTGAKIENANFEGAKYSEKTIWPKFFNPKSTGAILNNNFYQFEQQKIAQKARAREEEQRKKEMIEESQNLSSPYFPSFFYKRLKSALGLLSDFTYTTIGNKIIGINPTECSTIELVGSENVFTELILRVDYVNENSFNWASYVLGLVNLFLDQEYRAVCDWLRPQEKLAFSSQSDIKSEKIFGGYLISFRSNRLEGTGEYSFKRVQK